MPARGKKNWKFKKTKFHTPQESHVGKKWDVVDACAGEARDDVGFRVWGLGFRVWGLGFRV
jgi:hypothetical protein